LTKKKKNSIIDSKSCSENRATSKREAVYMDILIVSLIRTWRTVNNEHAFGQVYSAQNPNRSCNLSRVELLGLFFKVCLDRFFMRKISDRNTDNDLKAGKQVLRRFSKQDRGFNSNLSCRKICERA
jgi:hypothetical protein